MAGFSLNDTGGGRKKWVKPLLWTILAVVIVAVIVIPIAVVFSQQAADGPKVPLTGRVDCFPLDPVQEDGCTKAGCIWEPQENAPSCFFPATSGYELLNAPQLSASGMTVEIGLRNDTPAPYGPNHEELVFEVAYYSNNMLGFRLHKTGVNGDQLRPPVPLSIPAPSAVTNPLYEVKLNSSDVGGLFNFKIVRKSSQVTLFDTSLGLLSVADQFLSITTALPTKYLYGIGENNHDSFAHNMDYRMWPLFARDQPPADGELNLYGSHPFYYVSEDDGSSHGVFFFNSHSIDVTTLPYPGLTYRTIGGQLEFFVFMGPTPEDVVNQYTSLIGRTMMPAYWSLGFQLSRYGYKDTQDIRNVVERTRNASIPLEVQYADIDHMDDQADFTLGPEFSDLPDLLKEIHDNNMHFIIILDPAINAEKAGYETNDRALQNDVYVKWFNETMQPEGDCSVNASICQPLQDIMLGYVWPVNRTAFPDFFKTSTKTWWTNEIRLFHDKLPFDGLWIDMNEPANFDTNKDKPFNWPAGVPAWNLHCPVNQWDDPPYATKAARYQAVPRLSDKTLCMIAKQGPNDEYLHYQVHNLYGWSQTESTLNAARQVTGGRSIVITRSTFPSSGRWAGHWLGDNTSRWKDLHRSIIGMLEFNMFGIPYIGADICGFFGNTTENMCLRWMQLGAFYPFSRNHNGLEGIPQDPAQWPSVANASRIALSIRYSLLPYLYTLFHDSHHTGRTVVRPLFHEYPRDNTAKTVDKQFLWGPALLITPVLEENKLQVTGYFPDDIWYDYYTGQEVATKGGNVVLDAPLDKINLHVRGGYILPHQTPSLTIADSREGNFSLLVAVGKDKTSRGDLFWDDGVTLDEEASQLSRFTFNWTSLSMTVTHPGPAGLFTGQQMGTVTVFGMSQRPSNITVSGSGLADSQIAYDASTKKLTLSGLSFPMDEDWSLDFAY